MLLDVWRGFKGWSVIEFFLKEDKRIHVKGLSRELKVSPRTAQVYLQLYEKLGLLKSERVGNLKLYGLVSNSLTHELKRLYFIALIMPHIEKFVKSNGSISTLVLYGSYATGEYDKSSDVDILAISSKKELNLDAAKALETRLGKEVKIEVFNFAEWRQLEVKKDLFYYSVIKNHILLHGAKI